MNPNQQNSKRKRAAVLLAVIFLALVTLAWRSQVTATFNAQNTPQETAAPSVEQFTPTPTRFPEIYTNQDQTNGVVLGSTILVMIIIIGTLTVVRHSTPKKP